MDEQTLSALSQVPTYVVLLWLLYMQEKRFAKMCDVITGLLKEEKVE